MNISFIQSEIGRVVLDYLTTVIHEVANDVTLETPETLDETEAETE